MRFLQQVLPEHEHRRTHGLFPVPQRLHAAGALATILFLGGWLSPIPFAPFTWVPGIIWFTLKVLFMFFLIAMAKAIVPRYRYDQLMRLGWKVFLPLSLGYVILVAAVLQFGGLAPK